MKDSEGLKYIQTYIKRNIRLALICAVICFVPLFITSLVYDVLWYDMLVSFIPFLFAGICVLISLLPVSRFRNMISYQESLYGIQFPKDRAEHLETTLYLSKDWLIWAGSCAFYGDYVKSIKYDPVVSRAGTSCKLTITIVEHDEFTIWCLSYATQNKIRAWHKYHTRSRSASSHAAKAEIDMIRNIIDD